MRRSICSRTSSRRLKRLSLWMSTCGASKRRHLIALGRVRSCLHARVRIILRRSLWALSRSSRAAKLRHCVWHLAGGFCAWRVSIRVRIGSGVRLLLAHRRERTHTRRAKLLWRTCTGWHTKTVGSLLFALSLKFGIPLFVVVNKILIAVFFLVTLFKVIIIADLLFLLLWASRDLSRRSLGSRNSHRLHLRSTDGHLGRRVSAHIRLLGLLVLLHVLCLL